MSISLTVPLCSRLNILMRHAFHRARPSFEAPVLALTTYRFTSGQVSRLQRDDRQGHHGSLLSASA